MRDLALIIPTYYGLDAGCRAGVSQCVERGAHLLEIHGCSNVTLARNIALTRALEAPATWLLLVDDDIGFAADDAEQLLSYARANGSRPTSGIYLLAPERAAAQRVGKTWLTGLGFFALPQAALRTLTAHLPLCVSRSGEHFYPFCQSGLDRNGHWRTEDMWLCQELGGVALAPVSVAHHKAAGTLVPSRELVGALT